MDVTTPVPASAEPPAEPIADPLRAYRTWAWRFFAILAAVVGLGLLLVLTAHDQDPLAVAGVLVIGGLSAALLVVFLQGIDRQAAWAVHAIAPVCAIVIVFGILRAAAALLSNSITIPLEVIGAALVLSRPHPASLMPALGPPDDRRVTLLVGALAVTQLAPYLFGQVGTGGFLGVQPRDLDLAISISCDQVAAGGTAPVTVSWSWRRGEPLPPSFDGIVLSWYGFTDSPDASDAGMFIPNEPRTSDPHIGVGGEGQALGALQPYAQQGPYIEFAIDHRGGLSGGEIAFDFARSESTARSGVVNVQLWYAHGARWVERYESETCQWGAQQTS